MMTPNGVFAGYYRAVYQEVGKIKLPLTSHSHFEVRGGSFWHCPKNVFSVNMADEIYLMADVSLPVADQSVPHASLLDAALPLIVEAILRGDPVYVGCMGGIGRTGLMLAVLAKSFGVEFPVAYVRTHYDPHACENLMQMNFVTQYRIPKTVQRMIKRKRAFQYWKPFTKGNLTQPSLPDL